MNDPQTEPLSPAGLARREAMLEDLIGVVKRTHRVRRVRRRALAAGGCVCVTLMAVWLALPGASGPHRVASTVQRPTGGPDVRVVEPPLVPVRQACVIAIVHTDPTVLERCRARSTGLVVRMDDRMLLDTLASIDRPAGLIRFGNRVRLSAPVTDADLGLP